METHGKKKQKNTYGTDKNKKTIFWHQASKMLIARNNNLTNIVFDGGFVEQKTLPAVLHSSSTTVGDRQFQMSLSKEGGNGWTCDRRRNGKKALARKTVGNSIHLIDMYILYKYLYLSNSFMLHI